MNYYTKYIKYKTKYLNLLRGGNGADGADADADSTNGDIILWFTIIGYTINDCNWEIDQITGKRVFVGPEDDSIYWWGSPDNCIVWTFSKTKPELHFEYADSTRFHLNSDLSLLVPWDESAKRPTIYLTPEKQKFLLTKMKPYNLSENGYYIDLYDFMPNGYGITLDGRQTVEMPVYREHEHCEKCGRAKHYYDDCCPKCYELILFNTDDEDTSDNEHICSHINALTQEEIDTHLGCYTCIKNKQTGYKIIEFEQILDEPVIPVIPPVPVVPPVPVAPPVPVVPVVPPVPNASSGLSIRDKVYVFDFDCTLTGRHFYYFIHNFGAFESMYPSSSDKYLRMRKNLYNFYAGYFKNNEELDKSEDLYYNKVMFLNLIFSGLHRIKIIKEMFERIGKENLYIASKGDKEQILKLLSLAELRSFIKDENVYGNEMAKDKLLKDIFLYKNRDLFYADDNHEEHNKFVSSLNFELVKQTPDDSVKVDIYKNTRTNKTYTFYKCLTLNKAGGIPDDDLLSIP
jgi:hypothetical protein